MLKQRIITAAILIILVILGIFYLPLFWFDTVAAILFLLAAWEWGMLMGLAQPVPRLIYILVNLLAIAVFNYLPAAVILPLGFITWIILTYFVFHYQKFAHICSRQLWVRGLLGVWVIALTWFSIVFIRAEPNGAWLLLLLLVWVWGADTGAYFVGRRWGKRKLAPTISPGKSVEGVVGGVITTFLLAVIIGLFFSSTLAYYGALLWLALLVAIISVIGDLFESMLKRQSGVKDSGQWLPGHGGILDRIDSLLSSAPIFACGIWLLLR
jgi:phosphatidate cytidylyltransferase